jgi:hypothetical protein
MQLYIKVKELNANFTLLKSYSIDKKQRGWMNFSFLRFCENKRLI